MIYYIGGFPPPFGGVTVKNILLYSELEKEINNYDKKIQKIDTQRSKKNIILLVKYILLLTLNREGKYIIATAGKSRKRITTMLYMLNRKMLSSSILIVMGGYFAESIKSDDNYIKKLKLFKQIYVETHKMKEKLETLGFSNISIYPNCRKDSEVAQVIQPSINEQLKCVFFSLISEQKGADIVLDVAEKSPNIQFDFWGEIDKGFFSFFEKRVSELNNVHYCGVFKSDGNNIYEKLHEYDLLLLPTRWKYEGVPGVLVEAKIASLPAIVSDICYNAEIVENGVSGIVLCNNNYFCLKKELDDLNVNRNRLRKLKEGALKSAKMYFIDNYIIELLDVLEVQI
jgi:glycosyltransferase involved in cell wall biosynthesis